MKFGAKFLTRSGRWLRHHRAQLGLSLRVTVSAVIALGIAQYLNLTLPLWAVLTALIVTQMSVGRSLKATRDYLVGTLGGALYGGAIAVFVPHVNEFALLLVLAMAVGPMALIAAMNPSLSVAPITVIIVLLVPTITHASPLASAVDRVLEVAVGAFTGLAVSFLLLPSTAHRMAIEAASGALSRMAQAVGELLAGLTQGLEVDALRRIQDGIGDALAQLHAVGAEATRERAAHLTAEPDIAPLLRTLLRLRHDLVMIGRAAVVPLPEALHARLKSTLTKIGVFASDYLEASSAALLARREPPSLAAVDAALDAYTVEIAALRAEGLTRAFPEDVAERFFAVGFALEQLHQNFKDLERCVAEWAASKHIVREMAET
jgi:uncharacterized membrane protein YccC